MIKFAICDDHPQELAALSNILQSYLFQKKIIHSLESFQDSYTLLDAVKNKKHFDILILDIILPDMDGIALAKALRKMKNDSSIIFLTTSMEYALKSYEVNAFQYLLKPLDEKKLYAILDQLLEKLLLNQAQHLIVTTVMGIQNLKACDISFIEHINHVLYINMRDGSIVTTANSTATLTEFENQLNDSNFLRPHRAFVVNLFVVRTLTSDSFILDNGSLIPIARRRYKLVKETYLNFLLHSQKGVIL